MEWRKPSVEAKEHKYIIALAKVENEYGKDPRKLLFLRFYGIRNSWFTGEADYIEIKLSDIIYWFPRPELPDRCIGDT